MAESTIITGQFVRISQTPASIGERLIALVIDYILLGFYVFSTLALFSRIHLPLISRCFSSSLSSTCRSCFTHFSAKCSTRTKSRQAADEHPCRKSRRFHARYRLVPAPMASLSYRRTGDRWPGTSGRPFDQTASEWATLLPAPW